MKEETAGNVLSTSDNSSIRAFLSREMIAERSVPATQPIDVPQPAVPIDPIVAPKPPAPAAVVPTAAAVPPAPKVQFGVATWGMHSLLSPMMNWMTRCDVSLRQTIAMEISRREQPLIFTKPTAVTDTKDAADVNR